MQKVSVLLLPLLFIASCTATKQVEVSKQTFTFDYAPKQERKPGSANMTLAFIKPYYATKFTSAGTELFSRFKDALSNDIEELIVAKGFSLKGPYTAFDEMVFGDKKTIDMAIKIEIEPEFTSVDGHWQQHVSIPYNIYTYSGTASLVGKINISGIEPLTNERLLTKSVSIPNIENIQIESTGKYYRPLQNNEIFQDPGIYNAIGRALSQQYNGILEKIAAHFDAEELGSYKQQIKELKSTKRF